MFSFKKVLRISQNSQENTCVKGSLLIKVQSRAQVFRCKFGELLKKIFLIEHLQAASSIMIISSISQQTVPCLKLSIKLAE